MKRKPPRDDGPADTDGVRVVHDDRTALERGLPLIVFASAAVLAVLLFTPRVEEPPSVHGPEAAGDGGAGLVEAPLPGRTGAPASHTERPPVARRVPARASDPLVPPHERARAPAAAAEAPAEIGAGEYIAALRAAGETGGLAAFPPPGTRPPRAGVIVPPDYELPEGFARHHQVTDDGRRLPPILALAPGYELLDDAGRPVPLTDDRIVPPELAPPDLPIEMLEIPSADPAR